MFQNNLKNAIRKNAIYFATNQLFFEKTEKDIYNCVNFLPDNFVVLCIIVNKLFDCINWLFQQIK